MKKLHILSILLITFLTLSIPAEARHRYKQISISELPSEGKSFLKNHFKKNKVYHIKRDKHGYDIQLDKNIKVKLDYYAHWKQIKTKEYGALPQSIQKLLPKKTNSYIKQNFKDWRITEIKRKDYGYKVELDNGRRDAELKFNHNGDILKVDY